MTFARDKTCWYNKPFLMIAIVKKHTADLRGGGKIDIILWRKNKGHNQMFSASGLFYLWILIFNTKHGLMKSAVSPQLQPNVECNESLVMQILPRILSFQWKRGILNPENSSPVTKRALREKLKPSKGRLNIICIALVHTFVILQITST